MNKLFLEDYIQSFQKINNKKLVNLSIPDKFIFENLGREMLLDKNGLSAQNILKKLKKNIT